MNVIETELPGVLIIEPRVFGDDRGYFLETWNRDAYAAAGLDLTFVQDNLSSSSRGVLRGLHYQLPNGQGKLVSCVLGLQQGGGGQRPLGRPRHRDRLAGRRPDPLRQGPGRPAAGRRPRRPPAGVNRRVT